jgi:hypothetical protein
MALQSKLFRGDPKLEAAAKSNPAHILPGASGPHVGKIQTALTQLDGAVISSNELQSFRGPWLAMSRLVSSNQRESNMQRAVLRGLRRRFSIRASSCISRGDLAPNFTQDFSERPEGTSQR